MQIDRELSNKEKEFLEDNRLNSEGRKILLESFLYGEKFEKEQTDERSY